MHIEFLVEDQSCENAMEILLPKLLRNSITYRIHSYKGVGKLPKDLKPHTDAVKRILLDRLPRILQGYAKTQGFCDLVIVICDLDDKDKSVFLFELNEMLDKCNQKPDTLFCLAIEELEAWYLGDLNAIRSAYPNAKNAILNVYINDAICGTWEKLADAVYKGGSNELKKLGWQRVGEEKSKWAKNISPYMDVDSNKSPSFMYLRTKLCSI
jgi:hypothetical protein